MAVLTTATYLPRTKQNRYVYVLFGGDDVIERDGRIHKIILIQLNLRQGSREEGINVPNAKELNKL